MNRYLSHTQSDIDVMFKKLNIKKMEDLFVDIPSELRMKKELNLPLMKSELEVSKHISGLAAKNYSSDKYAYFLGAGAYDVYVPAIIKHITGRAEYLTSYTPYQPEISQGTLQTIFEFQTMMCSLTGMDVCNASMYDGATAAAEALLLAIVNTKSDKVLISKGVNPQTIEVAKLYLDAQKLQYELVDLKDGQTDLDDKEENIAGVLVQSPNYYGVVEDLDAIGKKVKSKNAKALFIAYTDPSTLGVLKPPGESNADVVVGEAQTLGIPLSFGGPYLGFMAVKEAYTRKIPGRVVGQTFDKEGNTRYVLTLQAREQHIRRFKAVSNICSNQGLIMTMSTIYMSLMGKQGIYDVGYQSASKAHYFYNKLVATKAFKPAFNAPFFKEFTLISNIDLAKLSKKLLEHNIVNGFQLKDDINGLENAILLAVTEKRSKEEMDLFIKVVEEVI